MYQDKMLTCKDCNSEFVFTAREQEFYDSKGFQNEPGRCPACRSNKKQQAGAREMHQAVCSSCGVTTTVPFKPTGSKPVYCKECFLKSKSL